MIVACIDAVANRRDANVIMRTVSCMVDAVSGYILRGTRSSKLNPRGAVNEAIVLVTHWIDNHCPYTGKRAERDEMAYNTVCVSTCNNANLCLCVSNR